MLDNFFRRSAVQKLYEENKNFLTRVRMKQYVEIDSVASTGCEGK